MKRAFSSGPPQTARQSAGRVLKKVLLSLLLAGVMLSGCSPAGGTASGEKREEAAQFQAEEWFYNSFDERKKAAYDAFRRAAADPFSGEAVLISDEKGETVKIPAGDLDQVYQGFLYDHPEVFWLSRTYNYRVSGENGQEEYADAVAVIPLPGSAQELIAQKEEFESSAAQLLQGIEDKENDRERAAALYERLVGQTRYEEEAMYDDSLGLDHTAYGVIAGKRGVCDGIALAYKYLLGRCGIPSVLIPGESGGSAHVWNTVFWDDGWHETDLTWDIASEGNDSMQYFDLATEEMNKDHIRETEGIALVVPAAQ